MKRVTRVAFGLAGAVAAAGLVPNTTPLFASAVTWIKMSAMPAWGKSLDDAAIWDIVSFVRKMPGMTPEAYQQRSHGHSG